MTDERRQDDARIADTQRTMHDLDQVVRETLTQHDKRISALEMRADWQKDQIADIRDQLNGLRKNTTDILAKLNDHANMDAAGHIRLLTTILLMLGLQLFLIFKDKLL